RLGVGIRVRVVRLVEHAVVEGAAVAGEAVRADGRGPGELHDDRKAGRRSVAGTVAERIGGLVTVVAVDRYALAVAGEEHGIGARRSGSTRDDVARGGGRGVAAAVVRDAEAALREQRIDDADGVERTAHPRIDRPR